MIRREWERLRSGLYVPQFVTGLSKAEPRRRPRRCRSWRARSRLGGWFPCPECCEEESSSSSLGFSSSSSASCSTHSSSLDDCPHCTTGNLPDLQVDLAGVTNLNCATCASAVNGSFIAGQFGACIKSYTFSAGCHPDSIKVEVLSVGGYHVKVDVNDILNTAQFRKNFASKPDCTSWSVLDIPYVGGTSSDCDFTSATCKLTSL